MAVDHIEGLLRYWPFANTAKEQNFIAELGEVLEYVDHEQVKPHIPKIYKRIAKCLGGDNMGVADRTMCLFENQFFLNLTNKYNEITFPILLPMVQNLAKTHWQTNLRATMGEISLVLQDMNSEAFEKASEINFEETLK